MMLIVNIDTPDLAAGIAFYTEALGLTLSRVLDDDIAELSGASSVIYLLQVPPGSTPAGPRSPGRDYSRHWTPVHMDFVVDDVDAAAERAKIAGAKQESEYIEWNGSRCITFSDPFGHGFCLIEFDGETYGDRDTAGRR